MEKTSIFIDAGYLDAIFKNHINIKIQYQKMIQDLTTGKELLRAYYY